MYEFIIAASGLILFWMWYKSDAENAPAPSLPKPEYERGANILSMLQERGYDLDALAQNPMFIQAARQYQAKELSANDMLRIVENLNIFAGGDLDKRVRGESRSNHVPTET